MRCQNKMLILKNTYCNSDYTTITSIVELEVSLNSTILKCGEDEYKTITVPLPGNHQYCVPMHTTCTYVNSVLLTVPSVRLFSLSDQIKKTDDDNIWRVNISWQETTTEKHQRYNVTVEPGVQGCNTTCMREYPYMELNVAINTSYNMSIITVICNGSQQSAASEPFPILLNGTFVDACTHIMLSKALHVHIIL